jgi:hypothetical protein
MCECTFQNKINNKKVYSSCMGKGRRVRKNGTIYWHTRLKDVEWNVVND